MNWPDHPAAIEQILADFGRAQAARSHSRVWLAGAARAVSSLLHVKVGVLGEPPVGWTPDQVQACLLRHLPAHALVPADQAAQYPDWLDAFFEWLGESGLETPAAAGKLRARLARCGPRFVAAVTAPRRPGLSPGRSGPAR